MISDIFSFGLGIIAGLVLIQFYPPAANVGKWIVEQAREGIRKINS